MKYGYIAYGNMNPELLQASTEERKKEMDRVKEEAEKHGFKMKYWGHPYGVSENIVVVFKSEKGLDDYFKMNINFPYTGTRTNLVIIP
jgi:cell fate regulator YaaT (PSP1 superfamily)